MCKESLQREKGGAGLAFISCDSQGRRSLSKGDRRPLNGTCTLAARFFFFFPLFFFSFPSPLASFCAAQHFCSLLTFSLPLWHISVILRPITAALAYITVSLPSFFIPSFLPSYARSPSPVLALFPLAHTHTQAVALFLAVPSRKMLSFHSEPNSH